MWPDASLETPPADTHMDTDTSNQAILQRSSAMPETFKFGILLTLGRHFKKIKIVIMKACKALASATLTEHGGLEGKLHFQPWQQ